MQISRRFCVYFQQFVVCSLINQDPFTQFVKVAGSWMDGNDYRNAARRLNVSFGINTNPKILCPEDLFQADHELQHLQKTVF
ncbi:hypothetical protein TNCV_2311431 [Trichonephila clavipes]|nr:hypothetical protein TNCV_2311431 [Trichonephila clavipes]